LKRGTAEERELVHKLDSLGFAVLRAPASGSSTKLDRPDIIAGKKGLHLVFEVKTTRGNIIYMKKESVEQLVRFSNKFGAEALMAIKFKGKNHKWILLKPENLGKTKKGYKIAFKDAIKLGISLEALVSSKITDFM
jgi:Holliday junction resolvase